MYSAVLPLLRCPSCMRGAIELRMAVHITKEGQIKDGILLCSRCGLDFPVMDWIPRLVVSEARTIEEYNFLIDHGITLSDSFPDSIIITDSAANLSSREREKKIRALLAVKLRMEEAQNKKSQKRVAHDLAYRAEHAGETEKYVQTIAPYVHTPVRVLADLGGGQGGTVSTFRRLLTAPTALLIDIDLEYATIARLRDPAVTVIRADARRLPFRDGAIDLLVSFATLEHIAELPAVIAEVTRAATQAFLSFNPNKWSVYDFGHLSAPVAMLPRAAVPSVAWLWHRVNGYRWSYARIVQELGIVFYHSRQEVARLLRAAGSVRNVFPDFVVHSAQASYAYRFAGLKKFFRKHPRVLRMLARVLVVLGIEPNVYLFWQKKKLLSS